MFKHCALFITCLCLTAPGSAEPYTPSPTSVVAEWKTTQAELIQNAQTANDPQAITELANAYLNAASQPGQARLYGLAEAVLKPLIEKSVNYPGIWLAWAQVQQHQHAFDQALKALDHVLQSSPHHTTANLMAARIHLVQGNADAARSACLQLLGHANLLTASACTLEVTSHQGKLEKSYQQLSQLINRRGFPDDARGPWLAQMLGNMALRLERPKEAVQWLDRQLQNANANSSASANTSVSYLAQWARAQLAAENYQPVIDYLKPIVQAAPTIDDVLLLRLAQAEKHLGGNHWQTKLAARVRLREQRQDTQHASGIARYYLHINPQPEKALYWARLNWQTARGYFDKKLLQQAEELAKKSQAGSPVDSQVGSQIENRG